MSAPGVHHITELSGLPRLRQAWGVQQTLPLLTTREQRRRTPSAVPTIDTLPSPAPTPRVKLQAPKIKLPVKPAYQPPHTESLFESLEQDDEISDMQRKVENFKQKHLSDDAQEFMFAAMYVQHKKTKMMYMLRNMELEAENIALKKKIKQISDELVCPISHEALRNPVILRDGFTYERENIEQWFAIGENTSPITREFIRRPRIRNMMVHKVLDALKAE